MHTQAFSHTWYDLQEIKSLLQDKVSRHEHHAFADILERMEHTLRDINAENSRLTDRVRQLEDRLRELETLSRYRDLTQSS